MPWCNWSYFLKFHHWNLAKLCALVASIGGQAGAKFDSPMGAECIIEMDGSNLLVLPEKRCGAVKFINTISRNNHILCHLDLISWSSGTTVNWWCCSWWIVKLWWARVDKNCMSWMSAKLCAVTPRDSNVCLGMFDEVRGLFGEVRGVVWRSQGKVSIDHSRVD